MLRSCFHPRAWPVWVLNFLAFLEAVLLTRQEGGFPPRSALGPLTLFVIFSWAFFNLLDWINWYPGLKGRWGIRIHFQRNIVLVSYLSFGALSLKLLGAPEWTLAPFALLLIPCYFLSLTLLSYHYRDTSRLRPNYFSYNFYLNKKEGI